MQPTDFNLRHLRAFCAIADCGSISAASEVVFLSQPAITQAMAKLEQTLGTRLFERKPRGMFLTEPGGLFRNRAERALSRIRDAVLKGARPAAQSRPRGFRQFDLLLTSAQLRALMMVSETGNFSWAARKIGVSQPTIHRACRDLERLAGSTLFDKTAQGIELTSSARVLARQAQLAYSELDQGLAEVNSWLGNNTARIVVGSLPLIRSQILPNAINAFSDVYPNAQIRVLDGAYDSLLHDLRHGQIDILVGALRESVPVDDVVQSELFEDQLAIVARTGHPLANKRNISVSDLTDYPWVVPRPGIPTRHYFETLIQGAGLAPPTRLVESSSLALTRGLLIGSDRLTVISAHQIRQEVNQGLLCYLDVPLIGGSRPIGLTQRSDWQPTASQSLLLTLLREESQNRQTKLSPGYSKSE